MFKNSKLCLMKLSNAVGISLLLLLFVLIFPLKLIEPFFIVPNFKGFSDETVRGLLAVSDYNFDGNLDYKECCELYPKVMNWTVSLIFFKLT